MSDTHVKWLREYIDEGGFIFAVANCGDGSFDTGFRALVERMFPEGDASLQRLQSDHPVFRSEYPLPNAESIELYGVDFGCRTAIIYSPEDLGCIWQKWMRHDPPERSPALIQRIIRGTRIGTNVLAYATGREPPVKLNSDGKSQEGRKQQINRGLAEIAQLRHTGGWDTAPKALRNLLEGLNDTVGLSVSVKRRVIPVTLDQLRQFPITYMHGRYRFNLGLAERDALRDHLNRGGVLFADACCGSRQFDRSFRDLMVQMFPDQKLERIAPDHEIFTEETGRRLQKLKIRRQVPGEATAALQNRTEEIPPVLEGIEIDGRLAVIYSRYDISCALENQASLACDGYLEEDAMKTGHQCHPVRHAAGRQRTVTIKTITAITITANHHRETSPQESPPPHHILVAQKSCAGPPTREPSSGRGVMAGDRPWIIGGHRSSAIDHRSGILCGHSTAVSTARSSTCW